MLNNKSRAFIFVSLFIVLSDLIFIVLNYRASLVTLDQDVKAWAAQSRNLFEIALDAKSLSMQQLATYVASDPRVVALFQQSREAVEAEGGGAGGSRAHALREQLFDLVMPSWKIVTTRYDVRQLHFHLGPGSTSFLRVHRPEKFGDNMDDVRFTIVDANQKRVPTRGFETGRVYSGIRGVVPVFTAPSPSGQRAHIGALEAGTSFTTLLNAMKKEMGSNVCILLTRDHVTRNMWPDFVKTHFTGELRCDDWFLEASTASGTKGLLGSEAFQDLLRQGVGAAFIKTPSPIQACVFPLVDYRGSVTRGLAPAGTVIVWKDASGRWAHFRKTLINNIVYAVLALLVVETVLFIAWQASRNRLQGIIDRQTGEINANYKRLKDIIDAMPIGILVAGYRSGKILEANPEAARMLNIPQEAIPGRTVAEFLRQGKDGEDEAVLILDGKSVPVMKMEILTELQGNRVNIISLVDLTEQKEAEQERIQREKFQGVLEMAGAICHELNQPFMIISGFSELLINDLSEETAHHDKVSQIKLQVDRMGEITRKLMKITRYRTKNYLEGRIIDIDEASSDKPRKK